MGVGAGLYMYDVVVKSSHSLSDLLMSSCFKILTCTLLHNAFAPGRFFLEIILVLFLFNILFFFAANVFTKWNTARAAYADGSHQL